MFLIIFLKRFKANGMHKTKNDARIDFPLYEPLDLSEYVNDDKAKFELYGIINH